MRLLAIWTLAAAAAATRDAPAPVAIGLQLLTNGTVAAVRLPNAFFSELRRPHDDWVGHPLRARLRTEAAPPERLRRRNELPPDLATLSVRELKALARERRLNIDYPMEKSELVAKIEATFR